MKKLSIIIPAKNEEKRIAKTLSNYGSFFASKRRVLDTEIVVVISNTKDLTSKIVDKYSEEFSFIKKIETPYDSGKGGAVALGFKKADGDYIGFTDADGAVSASEFYSLYNFLDETPWLDGATGSRSKEKSKISFRRKVLKNIFNLYVKILFNLPYEDTQCGAKVFRKKAAKIIAEKLSNTGWAFDVNLLLVAKYLNLRILEFPIVWLEKEGSKFSLFVALFKVPFEFLKLKYLEINYKIDVSVSDFVKTPLEPKKKMAKNILIFAWRDVKSLEKGGSEIYVHEVAKRLIKKYNVTLFTSRPGNLNKKDIIDGVKIIRRGNFLTVYFWAFWYYTFHLRKHTDVIVDVENGIPFFTPLYSRKPKLMVVHHIHKGQWFKQFFFPFAAIGYLIESVLMPLIYRKVPIVTVSPSSLNDIKKLGFNEKRVYLAYNSIPPKVGKNVSRYKDPLLLYVGRIKAYKQLEVAVKTIERLQKDFPKLSLVIGGTGDHLEKLRKYINKSKAKDKVKLLGYISEEEKFELMQKAWVFLMPSIREGWGITILEAAFCGIPSVGFNVDGVRDSIRDNLTGLLAKDLNDYHKRVGYLLQNTSYRNWLGENAIVWSSGFSWRKTVKVFEKVIEMLDKRGGLLDKSVYPWELDLASETITSLVGKSR